MKASGPLVQLKNLPALDIRLGALREAFKLKGSYAPVESAQAYAGVQVILMDKIPRPSKEKFEELERKYSAQLNGNKNNGNDPQK